MFYWTSGRSEWCPESGTDDLSVGLYDLLVTQLQRVQVIQGIATQRF